MLSVMAEESAVVGQSELDISRHNDDSTIISDNTVALMSSQNMYRTMKDFYTRESQNTKAEERYVIKQNQIFRKFPALAFSEANKPSAIDENEVH